jgi:hypothetical protein
MPDSSPNPAPNIVAAFAAFVRQRLAGLADVTNVVRETVSAPRAVTTQRRNIAMVIVAAAAPFAPTAHARARLLRQAHASGLLSARETDDALDVVRAIGAPRS